MLKDFREFALRGSVVDMAIGLVIGAAFGVIIKSLVSDIIMPPVGLLLGKVDFTNLFVILKAGKVAGPYLSLAEAQSAGAVTLNYGAFINTLISFVIIAFVAFLLIRQMNKLKREQVVATRDCPHCLTPIPKKATRCAHCTSAVTAEQ